MPILPILPKMQSPFCLICPISPVCILFAFPFAFPFANPQCSAVEAPQRGPLGHSERRKVNAEHGLTAV